MIRHFAQGFAIGLMAGVPLGPASAAVVDTALRRPLARALAIGVGAALVDFVYCLAAASGSGLLVGDRPVVTSILRLAGAVVLSLLGIAMLLRPAPAPERGQAARPVRTGTLLASVGTGVVISGLNPALATTWVVLAGTVLAGLTTGETLGASAGVFLGTFAWFVAIAVAAHRGRASLGARAVWVTRVAGLSMVAYGAFLLAGPLVAHVFEA
jgi:threonine/homoserine/homoserine lactone efflux protein